MVCTCVGRAPDAEARGCSLAIDAVADGRPNGAGVNPRRSPEPAGERSEMRDVLSRDNGSAAAEPAETPLVEAHQLTEVIERLRAARCELERRPVDRILEVLSGVVESWLAPTSTWRRRAESLLPAAADSRRRWFVTPCRR